ncbi:MAG: alpha/beta hydrolase [Candidatus Brocadiia bacterium]
MNPNDFRHGLHEQASRDGDVTRGWADVNGTRLYYETAGKGPPVVFLHADGLDSRIWDAQFAAFAANFSVYRFDMRGYGHSEMPTGSSFDAVLDVYFLFNFFGLRKAALVGCAYGGVLAVEFALRHPDLVSGLVLESAGLNGYPYSANISRKMSEMVSLLRAGDFNGAVELYVRLWVHGPNRDADKLVEARVRELLEEYSFVHFLPTQSARLSGQMPAASLAINRLREITAPTHVIVGDCDQPDILMIADILRKGIPRAKKTVIAGAGHLAHMEKPEEFNKIALGFLGGLKT